MSVSISSKTQNANQNKEYRCPKCSIIPFINIFTSENKIFMSNSVLTASELCMSNSF